MKKTIILLSILIVSCGAFGQVKTVTILDNFSTDNHGTRWEKITHFPQNEKGVYIQTKTDKGVLVSRLAPLKQDVLGFWVLTKRDSSNIRSIQRLVRFKGLTKSVLNDLVFGWYHYYKMQAEEADDVIIHTIDRLSLNIERLSK